MRQSLRGFMLQRVAENSFYAVPANVHTTPTEGHIWKFQGEGGVKQSITFRESMRINWNFWFGEPRGFNPKSSMGRVWIFYKSNRV